MAVVLTSLRRPGKGHRAQAGRAVLPSISCSAERKWLQQHTGHAGAKAISRGSITQHGPSDGCEVRAAEFGSLDKLALTLGSPSHV